MESARHLRVIDGNTGEINDDSVPVLSDVAALTEEIVDLRRKLAAAKGQITKLRAKIHALDPRAEDIERVLTYWREETNHPRAEIPFDGVRADATRKMLKLFTAEQLMRVCDVAGALPYEMYGERFAHPGPGRKRRDDATFLFANEARVERMLALADEGVEYAAYARWLFELCERYPRVRRMLAYLGAREPHGEVLVRAVRWARAQETQT